MNNLPHNIKVVSDYVSEMCKTHSGTLNPEWVIWSYRLIGNPNAINPEWLRAPKTILAITSLGNTSDDEPAMFYA